MTFGLALVALGPACIGCLLLCLAVVVFTAEPLEYFGSVVEFVASVVAVGALVGASLALVDGLASATGSGFDDGDSLCPVLG